MTKIRIRIGFEATFDDWSEEDYEEYDYEESLYRLKAFFFESIQDEYPTIDFAEVDSYYRRAEILNPKEICRQEAIDQCITRLRSNPGDQGNSFWIEEFCTQICTKGNYGIPNPELCQEICINHSTWDSERCQTFCIEIEPIYLFSECEKYCDEICDDIEHIRDSIIQSEEWLTWK